MIKSKDPFNLDFMDNYYDELMEEKSKPYEEPILGDFTESSIEINKEMEETNAFIDAMYMKVHDDIMAEFMANLGKPKTKQPLKYDYKKVKHLRDIKKTEK